MKEQFDRACTAMYLMIQNAVRKVRSDESGMEVLQVVLLLGAGLVVIGVLVAIGSAITTHVNTGTQTIMDGTSVSIARPGG